MPDYTRLETRVHLWNATTNVRYRTLETAANVNVSAAISDVGALTFDLDYAGLDSSLLAFVNGSSYFECSFEVLNSAQTWVEPYGCRFVITQRENNSSESNTLYKYTMASYASLLRRVLTAFPDGSWAVDDAGKPKNTRIMTGNPGTIMKTLIDEAKAYASLPGILYSFSGAATSLGYTWPSSSVVTIEVGPGDIMSILELLVDMGVCEYTTSGRTLYLFAAGGTGSDKSSMTLWRNGYEVVDAPNVVNMEEVTPLVVVINPDTGRVMMSGGQTNGTSVPWGALGRMIESPSTDQTTANQVYTTARAVATTPKKTFQRKFLLDALPYDTSGLNAITPLSYIGLGDSVTMENENVYSSTNVGGQRIVGRVIEWSVTKAENDKGTMLVTMGDRSYTNEVRLVRLLKRLVSRIKKKKS